MNVQILIDAIVRQTTVLIAQLATSGGVRAPLAHIANQVFVELADELESQGVTRKVSADMFGMALRSYRRKLQRLRESSTERGRSLWSALVGFLGERGGAVGLNEILARFHRDEVELVRGVLRDLSESGLVFRSGSGYGTRYRLAGQDDLATDPGGGDDAGRDALLWITVYRSGPLEREALLGAGGLDEATLDASLERLVADGRVQRRDSGDGRVLYGCDEVVVGLGASVGWEAAVLDHFQAAVRTIIGRLQRQVSRTSARDVVGGSTYTYDVWPGHPLRDEVFELLGELRERASALRERVEEHNATHARPEAVEHLTFYFGQHLAAEESTELDEP